uniref:Uncharacterized protein n=1 Tax=Chromera velia CCMP2878 TaxID=1169474 RepID=A0A0G4HH52_9ALVE|eukprot:Cvel_6844.t1-p1 / transcript=Cvel_6844.t1 / gene=Cvel_6844 / organism=Chromera_velia_CCMP2878 / gene_product=hypothetical protein / transcript_product=hypothetical protein / location=Cvel_scaffold345:53625-57636(-) / protein_length=595 / sequence_SO=supercontig / SO=protein_coding / is_pseudo=false
MDKMAEEEEKAGRGHTSLHDGGEKENQFASAGVYQTQQGFPLQAAAGPMGSRDTALVDTLPGDKEDRTPAFGGTFGLQARATIGADGRAFGEQPTGATDDALRRAPLRERMKDTAVAFPQGLREPPVTPETAALLQNIPSHPASTQEADRERRGPSRFYRLQPPGDPTEERRRILGRPGERGVPAGGLHPSTHSLSSSPALQERLHGAAAAAGGGREREMEGLGGGRAAFHSQGVGMGLEGSAGSYPGYPSAEGPMDHLPSAGVPLQGMGVPPPPRGEGEAGFAFHSFLPDSRAHKLVQEHGVRGRERAPWRPVGVVHNVPGARGRERERGGGVQEGEGEGWVSARFQGGGLDPQSCELFGVPIDDSISPSCPSVIILPPYFGEGTALRPPKGDVMARHAAARRQWESDRYLRAVSARQEPSKPRVARPSSVSRRWAEEEALYPDFSDWPEIEGEGGRLRTSQQQEQDPLRQRPFSAQPERERRGRSPAVSLRHPRRPVSPQSCVNLGGVAGVGRAPGSGGVCAEMRPLGVIHNKSVAGVVTTGKYPNRRCKPLPKPNDYVPPHLKRRDSLRLAVRKALVMSGPGADAPGSFRAW